MDLPVASDSSKALYLFEKAYGLRSFAEGSDGGRVHEEPTSCQVRAIRLADRITEPVDLLKVDIEGAEYEVLPDLCETGRMQFVNRVVCEMHVRAGYHEKLGEVLSALAQSGLQTSINFARSAADLPGNAEPTPFPAVPDGKCLLHIYAWRT